MLLEYLRDSVDDIFHHRKRRSHHLTCCADVVAQLLVLLLDGIKSLMGVSHEIGMRLFTIDYVLQALVDIF